MESRPDFRKSVAVAVGINAYGGGVPPLRTAAHDARRLSQLLADDHGYEVLLRLDDEATLARLTELLTDTLPAVVEPDDRVLFYFAGHGIALEGTGGPSGYLLPQDARRGEPETYLPMPVLYDALQALPCRHLLVILDSCFAGAFRWSTTRDMTSLPDVIHQERYDRFILDAAWQAIASASHDQKAIDHVPTGDAFAAALGLGQRDDGGAHSPFAAALFEALEGAGDVVPAGKGDGVITATELYLFLEERLQPATMAIDRRQTPRLWPLAKHDKGEFIFLVPDHELNLPPAPEPTYENNPWLGLKSYDEDDEDLFFGREDVIDKLLDYVEKHPLTVVLGASGTGKSSVVKAGLVPRLKRDVTAAWHVLPVVRPGPTPMQSLERAVAELGTEGDIEARIAAFVEAHDARLVLVIDQFEELVTLARSGEREAVLDLLARLVEAHPEGLRVVLTLRSDFEPPFAHSALEPHWQDARAIIPPMSQADLREVIERPASKEVMYFKPASLVDDLIDEVIQTPGGLPLLSFALSEMYVHYVNRYDDGETDDRALEREDYDAIGGVVGALRTRAEAKYHALDEAHRETLRRVMLRMVAPEGGNVARRRVPRSDLDYPDAEETERAHDVVRRLTEARLLVEGQGEDDEPYVEPAHDALVRAWDRLLRWIEDERDHPAGLRFQQRLARAAHDWEQTADARAKNGLLWRDAIRGRQLDSFLTHEEGRLGPSQSLVRSDRRSLLRTAATYAREGKRRAMRWRRAPDPPDADYRPWMNRRELAFAQRSTERRLLLQSGLTLLVLLIIAGAVVALVQAGIARENARESQARFLAAEMENALRDGDRPLAFRLAQEAWRTDDNASSRAALRRLSQTVLPLASVEGDKVLVPDSTPLIFTTRAIYDGQGTLVDSVRADRLAFAPSGAYFLAIYPDSASVRDAAYVLHDGATAQPLARFAPSAPTANAPRLVEDETAGLVAVADDAGQRLAEWPGALPLVSDDGRYLLSVRDVAYSPEFWMTWDLRDARGALLDTLAGYVRAPERPKPIWDNRGDGWTWEDQRLGPSLIRNDRVTFLDAAERPLLDFDIYNTEGGFGTGFTGWALLNDWQNNLIADFVFLRGLTQAGPPAPVSVEPERRVYNESGTISHFKLDADRFTQTQAHQSAQLFPASHTLVLWDNARGGELWSVDELRRARWLDGTYEKLSEDATRIVTRDGDDLIVWTWNGHVAERHRGLDVFPSPDPRRRLVVRDDSLTVVRVTVGDETPPVYEDTFTLEPTEGLSQQSRPEEFLRFDPEGGGFLTLAFDSVNAIRLGGEPFPLWDYHPVTRLRDWQGDVLATTHAVGVKREKEEPRVRTRPGEETTTRSCAPRSSLCAELVEKTIVVWDTLAAGPDRPDDADALRTFDLYERGAHVAFAPSGRFLLGVTASGLAKLWAFAPDFDPAAFVARYDRTLRPLTPEERTRYGIAD